jgi:hypothetical protein
MMYALIENLDKHFNFKPSVSLEERVTMFVD